MITNFFFSLSSLFIPYFSLVVSLPSELSRQTQKWIGAYKSLNESLKQLGDVANWSSVVEADMRFIARVLDNSVTVAQGTSTSSTPSSSSPAPSTTPSTSTSTNASSSSVTPS